MERLLKALVCPFGDVMDKAGISRIQIHRDRSAVLQFESGHTLTLEAPNTKLSQAAETDESK